MRSKALAFLALMALMSAPTFSPAEPGSPEARRVKVLFLGDNGHHVPLERCRDAYSALGQRGIDLTYTDDLSDLNPATLGRYDVLLIYANWTQIQPQQEKALLDYVEQGHGLAAIHCASYCFLNSPKYTQLVGARFKSHQTGVFKETIVEPNHPIEKGLKPIESWDETYVHEMHNPTDRQVLAYRVEGDHREPYTWTRTQGKGRVFYTAWGHDQRTWTNADFQNLLERGIRWAAGDWALAPRTSLKPFTYVPARVPFYPAGRPWGTTTEPLTQMQAPVEPTESIQHAVVAPGFELKLFASEPQIKKPICMAFDERGRLWVAQTFDYPNNMQQPGHGHDQITICQDTKGTGVADRFTVFADKLSIPTSICFANGGVIVSQAPDILFLKDTHGDGHADLRKVLFHGFGTQDTHAGPSNLRYGFDNWIYGTCGYSGFDGEVNGEHVRFGEGVFRFKADGSKLEFLSSTNNNTWGLGLSEDAEVFGSTANGNPAWYLHIPNRYYEQLAGWPATRLETIADTARFFPVTDKVRQVDFHGQYTAGAGSALYTARSFPRRYWNRIAFVSEPTGHLIGQFIVDPIGSDFRAINDFNLLASDDEWTAPIAAEVGPDGAVWMIDWYNYIVQHNPIPRGWSAGKGGAYETELRDKRHGRIYRIVWTGEKPSKVLDLSKASPQQLVEALKSDNMLWRMHAQRLLVEGGDRAVLPALVQLIQDPSVDSMGLNAAAVHALWALQGLGLLDGNNEQANAAVVAALRHPSAAVRKNACLVLPPTAVSQKAILDAGLLHDSDAQVRKDALLALSQTPPSLQAGAAIYAMISDPRHSQDRWLPDAIAIAGSRHDAGMLGAALAAHPGTGNSQPVAPSGNLVPNSSFEQVQGNLPAGWHTVIYSGRAEFAVDEPGHTGQRAIRISSTSGSDASISIPVDVEPRTQYRLSGWIKTRAVQRDGGLGALLNVHELQNPRAATPALVGTRDWQKVQVTFDSGDLRRVTINALFGGWGHARGTAWYDDIELTKSIAGGLSGPEGKILNTVIDQYARRGPSETVFATLEAASHADPALTQVIVDSLASNWPRNSSPRLSAADEAKLKELMSILPPSARDGLVALAQRWGRGDLFAEQAEAATKQLRDAVANSALDPSQRVESARRLLAIDARRQTGRFILSQISATQPPELQSGLLDVIGHSDAAEIGGDLVAQYPQFAPAAQRQAMNLLIRRQQWTGALLDAIDSGKIDNRDLLAQQWDALKNNPDEQIARRSAQLQQKTGHAPTADRKAIVEKFMPVASQPGDPARGRVVFEQNCIVCHTIDGQGGKVGPELSGIGARTKPDLLHKVLDPNSSVEGTYRQWIVRTKGGDVIAGRIFAENRTSLQLIDATAKLHEIERSDIDKLVPTPKTLMPEGFEQLGEAKLADLLSYLETSKTKK